MIRKRIRDDEQNRKRAEGRVKDIMLAKRRNNKKDEVKDPEFFTKNYRRKQKSYVIYKRKKDAVVNRMVSIKAQSDSAIFAIRIKHQDAVSKQEASILTKLMMTKRHNGIFIEPTSSNLQQLKLVENYIVYGHPSKTVMDELIRYRGFMDNEGKKVAITDNAMVEDKLSNLDIICIEDIVQSLYEGKHVDALQKDFLFTFLLSRNKKMDSQHNKKDKAKVHGGKHGYLSTKQMDLIVRKYM